MNKRNLYVAAAVLVVLLLGFGGWTLANQQAADDNASPTPTPTVTNQDTVAPTGNMSGNSNEVLNISYKGEDGKTALELLRKHYATETSGEGEMAFVTSINGREADTSKKEFWKFMINGEDAQVGAGSYQTKSGDEITWEIDTY